MDKVKEIIGELFDKRPKLPKRAVVTAGMPNGNKDLHLGHILLFISSDVFARFLRDNLGYENVIYVSGTDGYGSITEEKFRLLKEAGEVFGTVEDMVMKFHVIQTETIKKYGISLNLFSASCLCATKALKDARDIHTEISNKILDSFKKTGNIKKLATLSFYDEQAKCFLNGRQVEGKCPIEGCQSEVGYADECALGHQYSPSELIDPVSTGTKTKPVLREVNNYYFDLEVYNEYLTRMIEKLEGRSDTRKAMLKEVREFLKVPEIYIHESGTEGYKGCKAELPKHEVFENKTVLTLKFDKVSDRERAVEVLNANGVRFRTGKTLVPFRISGNAKWGVPITGEELTFYVWPESLWAPLSFVKAHLKESNSKYSLRDFWCSGDAKAYQFIGEDNIFFYNVAQPAMFKALSAGEEFKNLNMSTVVSYKHILVSGKKAATSGKYKAPKARELLDYYTSEQVKMHFLGHNFGYNTMEFKSKAFHPEMFGAEQDTFVAEGNLLTNIFNRIVRSVFYSIGEYCGNIMPKGEVSRAVLEESFKTIINYEIAMMNFEFYKIVNLLNDYFRNANKAWSKNMTDARNNNDIRLREQTIIDALFIIKTGIMLLHPITSDNTENVADRLGLDKTMFEWKNIFEPIYQFAKSLKIEPLPEKYDFFKKHPSQIDF
ncbi:MAG: class I tRNA ligase family protein [Christensenellaceae bacterium]|jgi:methionyl-tRNA synthetase|nr:class I tRNA ligase family protein [Christensenellaceae bacterium]